MADSFLHSGVGARLARVGAVALSMALGAAFLLDFVYANTASAQAAKKPPEKGAAAAKSTPDSSWVKLCDKGQLKGKDKDGKEQTKDVEMCMTLSEQIDANSGMVLVSATLQQVKVDGKEKQHFSVTVPPGVALPVGLRVTVFSKDLWDKVQKKEKLEKAEEEKLKAASVKLDYAYCMQVGCRAEIEAKPEFLNLLKGGAGFVVQTIRIPGTPVAQPVSLGGFQKALSNAPTDTQKFKEARTELMKQIQERQKQMLDELKKQQDDLNNMQPNVKPSKTPPAKK